MGPLDHFTTKELKALHAECLAWQASHPKRAARPNRLPRHTLTRVHDVAGDIQEIEAELDRRQKRSQPRRHVKHEDRKVFA